MELWDKIFAIVYDAVQCETGDFNATDATNAILSIPEIAEALAFKAQSDHHAELNRRAWEGNA